MDELPDLDTIGTLLTVVEGRDPSTTAASRFDDDHAVLRNTQAEVLDALTRELPPEYDKEALRRVLQRIEDDIAQNRSLRADAFAREVADQPQ